MTNPLKFDAAREERIRTRAYHMWENEGRPEGRAAEFWERAAELEMMEESGKTGQLPNPIAAGIDPSAPTGVEEAFIQENLGEFPGQLTDQGDAQPTPIAPKRKPAAAAESPAKPAKAAKPAKKEAAPAIANGAPHPAPAAPSAPAAAAPATAESSGKMAPKPAAAKKPAAGKAATKSGK